MIADFVIAIDGVSSFKRPDWIKDPSRAEAYLKRRGELKQERTLFQGDISTQDAELAPVRDQMISEMKQCAGGQFQKAGMICLFGSSNGAALALHNELTINYLCLADLPLFVGGRKPAIPGVGAMRPSAPSMIRTPHSLIGASTRILDGERPKVSLEPDINAKLKENYYQHAGNRIRKGYMSGDYSWTSDMPNSEFHGAIINSGWNREQEIGGLTVGPLGFFDRKDDALHAQLDEQVYRNIWGRRWQAEMAKF